AVNYGTSPASLTAVSVTYTGIAPDLYPESTVPPSKAGSYQVIARLSNDNYQATDATGTLTIGKKSASVTPNAAGKICGGADMAFTGTLTGFLVGDNVTATYSRTPGEAVTGSPYLISATLAPAEVLGNYNIIYNTASFVITAKHIMGSFTAGNKVYDGTTVANIDTRTLVGVISGNTVYLDGGSATFDTKSVGTHKTVTATGLLLAGADAGNYLLDPVPTTTANITAKLLTVTGLSAANNMYDGNTTATITGTCALSGVVAGDTVTLSGTPTGTFSDPAVGNGKTVSIGGLSMSGDQAANYTL